MSQNNSVRIYEEYGVVIKEQNLEKGTVVVSEHNFRSSERSAGDYEAYNSNYPMNENDIKKDTEKEKFKSETSLKKVLKKKWWLIVICALVLIGALITGLVLGLKDSTPVKSTTTSTTTTLATSATATSKATNSPKTKTSTIKSSTLKSITTEMPSTTFTAGNLKILKNKKDIFYFLSDFCVNCKIKDVELVCRANPESSINDLCQSSNWACFYQEIVEMTVCDDDYKKCCQELSCDHQTTVEQCTRVFNEYDLQVILTQLS